MKFDALKLKFNRYAFPIKQHSPEILMIAGAITVVGSAIMACKASTKVSAIIEDTNKQLDIVDDVAKKGDEELYSKEDAKHDTLIIYTQTGMKLAKLYAPWIVLGGLGLYSMFASHGIMKSRNAAMAAAYSVLDAGFKKYRERVAEQYGEDVENDIRYGIKAEKVTEVEACEDGKTHKVKKVVRTIDKNDPSVYAKFFDELCPTWRSDADLNLAFLRARESEANYRLRSQGYLFLNDVYDMLEIPRTKAGQAVGWIYDKDNPRGDNHISFKIYDGRTQEKRDFVNGLEKSILLDFNVDGPINDILPKF